MKVNYVLMYGSPYLKYKEFETFEDISKFLVNKRIVNYSIFKKLKDDEEVEMIYRDNDIRYLKEENEELKDKLDIFMLSNKTKQETIDKFRKRIDKAIEYIEKNKELLHHSFDEPDCDYWIATNPDELLKILRGEDNESN